jgi:hypothetical protein
MNSAASINGLLMKAWLKMSKGGAERYRKTCQSIRKVAFLNLHREVDKMMISMTIAMTRSS